MKKVNEEVNGNVSGGTQKNKIGGKMKGTFLKPWIRLEAPRSMVN